MVSAHLGPAPRIADRIAHHGGNGENNRREVHDRKNEKKQQFVDVCYDCCVILVAGFHGVTVYVHIYIIPYMT